MSHIAEHRTDMNQDLMKKEMKQVKEIFKGIDRCYDVAFVVGILTGEGTTSPMKESVNYAHGIPPEVREAKLGNATQCLPRIAHKIGVFLNTVCNVASPNDRFIDSNGDMESDTSIFHAWFYTDSGIICINKNK